MRKSGTKPAARGNKVRRVFENQNQPKWNRDFEATPTISLTAGQTMIPSSQKHRPASRDFNPNRSFRLPFIVGVIAVSLATGGALLRLFPRAVAPAAPFESESVPSRSKSESAPPLDALKQQTLQESHAPN